MTTSPVHFLIFPILNVFWPFAKKSYNWGRNDIFFRKNISFLIRAFLKKATSFHQNYFLKKNSNCKFWPIVIFCRRIRKMWSTLVFKNNFKFETLQTLASEDGNFKMASQRQKVWPWKMLFRPHYKKKAEKFKSREKSKLQFKLMLLEESKITALSTKIGAFIS